MSFKIIILHDEISNFATLDERETLLQVNQIEKVLLELKHKVLRLPFNGDLLALECILSKEKPTLVFNLVETYYKGRFLHLIPLLCERLNIKCTGGNANSLYLTGDKVFAKKLMKLANIPTPPFVENLSLKTFNSFIGQKVIKKPRDEEASVGLDDKSVFSITSNEVLKEEFLEAEKTNYFLELYIEGKECNVSVLTKNGSLIILPIAEMIFTNYPADKPKIVGYEAKWDVDSFAYKNTNRSFNFEKENSQLTTEIKRIVKKCCSVFDCSGYIRFDFRIAENGKPYLLELNVNPSLSEDGGFVAAAKRSNFSYSQIIEKIVEEALNGKSNVKRIS
jgi:D-alanine-D-alanine ligase